MQHHTLQRATYQCEPVMASRLGISEMSPSEERGVAMLKHRVDDVGENTYGELLRDAALLAESCMKLGSMSMACDRSSIVGNLHSGVNVKSSGSSLSWATRTGSGMLRVRL